MKRRLKTMVGMFILTFLAALPLQGTLVPDRPLLHPLFCDHMVLQRDRRLPVWGWAEPGARVTVEFMGQRRTAVADELGEWKVRLRRMPASAESQVLEVHSSTGNQSATIRDVLVGDVWLCSGQSNMEMGVGPCNVDEDIAAAEFPNIRLLTVPKRIQTEPTELLECHWARCTPAALIVEGTWGGFTAAGFFFGRELHQELGVPIGLIQSAWGGTVAEAWTSAEGLDPLDDFDEALEELRASNDPARKRSYPDRFEAWCQRQDPGSQQGWAREREDNTGWSRVEMPRIWEQAGLPGFDGLVWFRRTFELSPDWAGKDHQLNLGAIDDVDTTWINGVRVGQMNLFNLDRTYTVQADALKPGSNTITVRVLDTGGDGGFTGRAEQMSLKPVGDDSPSPITLAGDWWMRSSVPLADLSRPPQPPGQNNPNVPTVLYNGMIAPLQPFAIKGAIWYQGEANAGRAQQYRRLLPAMIEDWRNRFGVGDFPFYIVQLAAWQATHPEPRDNDWAELREAQAFTAQTVRNCGLALAVDVGDAADIHPKDKRTVGHRLALCALGQTYGRDLVFSGPWYRSMRVTPDGIRLTFDHSDAGLEARGGKLVGFAIAGEDRRFVWGDALIDGDTVWVSSSAVPDPVAVRYGWDINPVCNLYNGAGLPAVPFRTDDWPMTTRDR